jgi:hypothetical protein
MIPLWSYFMSFSVVAFDVICDAHIRHKAPLTRTKQTHIKFSSHGLTSQQMQPASPTSRMARAVASVVTGAKAILGTDFGVGFSTMPGRPSKNICVSAGESKLSSVSMTAKKH